MPGNLVKSIALKALSLGIALPEAQFDRFNELAHLRHLLAHLNINCVLDVGANRGQFAQELRGLGYVGRIVSFEPIPREFQAISKSFSQDQNWRGHRIALGSEEKTMVLGVPSLTVMSSLLEPLHPHGTLAQEIVEVKRLDRLFPSLVDGIETPRVLLKMDTQGYDVEVFKGAGDCIEQIVALQSELSVAPLYRNMPTYLEALGVYHAARFDLYNLSVVNRVADGGLLELNCLMHRASKS
jgi:FkbM family methyltransferase